MGTAATVSTALETVTTNEIRILVAGDPETLEVATTALGPLGEVVTTKSGGRALALLTSHAFDVVVVDSNPPRADAAELLGCAATIPRAVATILVGHAEDVRTYLNGAEGPRPDAVLHKPIDLGRLREVTEEVVLRVSARRSTRLTQQLIEELTSETDEENE